MDFLYNMRAQSIFCGIYNSLKNFSAYLPVPCNFEKKNRFKRTGVVILQCLELVADFAGHTPSLIGGN